MTIVYLTAKQDVVIRENRVYEGEVYMISNDILNPEFNVIGHELLKNSPLKPKVLYLYTNEINENFIKEIH